MSAANRRKRVLVATDGSETSRRAVDFAAQLTKLWDGELIVLTVRTVLSPEELRKLARANNYDLGIATEILVGRILDDAAELAKGRGVNMIKPLTVSGDPASATVKAAKAEQVDMIVAGRRGLGAVSRLLLGSVSGKIVANATCAVSVIP